MDKEQIKSENDKPKRPSRRPGLVRRYRLIVLALLVAVAMIGGSLAYAASKKQAAGGNENGKFDTAKVLPQPVSIPPSAPNKEFNAETLKQYDGQNGNKCYVAVKGKVYEIAGKTQWQGGQHLPSGGQAYCGVDLTDVIGKSPHGESKLQELPQVGTYQ